MTETDNFRYDQSPRGNQNQATASIGNFPG